jgi:hypothetical protein
VVTAVSVFAMLAVRRRAPEGSRFSDGDRASGVFGVLATGFSVLLGLVVFLSFNAYDQSRAGAEAEAVVVAQQFQTAQFFGEPTRSDLTGQLVCYARTVVGDEWDQMEAGTLGATVNPWGAAMFRTIQPVDPANDVEQSAYDRWLDQTSAREQARNERVHTVSGVIPSPLWMVLAFVSAVIFVFMLFFADSEEGALTQALLMGAVTAVITTLLLLILFFDQPYKDGVGGLQPDSMERAIAIIDRSAEAIDVTLAPPCDDLGRATT